MGGAETCAMCCAVYSVIGIVLLFFFGGMFQRGSTTFRLMAVKHQWDTDAKAQACYAAAIIYGVTLFISIVVKVFSSAKEPAAA